MKDTQNEAPTRGVRASRNLANSIFAARTLDTDRTAHGGEKKTPTGSTYPVDGWLGIPNCLSPFSVLSLAPYSTVSE